MAPPTRRHAIVAVLSSRMPPFTATALHLLVRWLFSRNGTVPIASDGSAPSEGLSVTILCAVTRELGSWIGLALSMLLAAAGLLRAQPHEATAVQGHSLAEHHCGTHDHSAAHDHAAAHDHCAAHDHAEVAPCEEFHPGLELSCCCDHAHAPLGAIEAMPSGARPRTAASLAPLAPHDCRGVDSAIPPRSPCRAVAAIAPVRPPGHLVSLRTIVILI